MKRLSRLIGLVSLVACAVAGIAEYTIRRTRFIAGDGNVVRTKLQISFEGTITVPRTGETVAERGHQTIVSEADGTFRFSGVSFNVHVPGAGVILLETGRLVLDAEGNVLKQSAKTSVDLAEKVCAALG
jgi:hypothetical protein